MCNQQLEKMFKKVDVEQNKVLSEEEKTTLTTATEDQETKCDSRIEKETNEKQAQIDDKEHNMNREKKNSKNDEDGNDKDSNHISEGKQELSGSNTVEVKQNAKHESIDSYIVEDSQNAKQELNDSNIIEDSQNPEQKLNDRDTVEDIKTTEKISDEEESAKKDINEKMEYISLRNNKNTNGILKFEKQEATSDLFEREQSNIKNVQNREEQIENQIFEEGRREETVNTSKKAHKESMENKASEKELGKYQKNNTEICGKDIKICGSSEGKWQKSEQNKEYSGRMIKHKKQYKEYDSKDNNSGVSRNKDHENEMNTHKGLKGVIQTAYHISKTSKKSSGKDGGSTEEAFQRKEKETNKQGERKNNNYSKNETKVTERLRTRSVSKEMNESGDQLPVAQNSSDLGKKTNEIQNAIRDICPVCDKYDKTGVQCGYCQSWFHFKCEDTTEEQVSKEYPAEQQ